MAEKLRRKNDGKAGKVTHQQQGKVSSKYQIKRAIKGTKVMETGRTKGKFREIKKPHNRIYRREIKKVRYITNK